MKIADYIMEFVASLGIQDVFCVTGGGAMHMNNALGQSDKLNGVFMLHEQGAAIAAEAYARVRDGYGCCLVTSGPGATNALTGLVGAYIDSIPVIFISGQAKRADLIGNQGIRQFGIQEVDIISMVSSYTKYAVQIQGPEDIKYEFQKAAAIAINGRPGPVWIDVPLDIQATSIDIEDLKDFDVLTLPTYDVKEELVDETIQLLNKAKKPVIMLGHGIRLSHSIKLAREIYNELGIPVLTSWNGVDLIEESHPLYYGRPGMVGQRAANLIQQSADFVLTIGTRLNLLNTGYNYESFLSRGVHVMVDIDENEWKKNQDKIETFVNKDIVAFMKAYCSHSTEEINAPKEWLEYCNKVKNKFSPFEGMITSKEHGRVNKYVFWKKMLDKAPKDSLFALGNSSIGMAANQIGRKYKDQRMISNYICGSMGFDLPAAVGLAVASRKNVYCVTGDGSIMMNLQELQTIIHNHLPIKIVVMENEGYGAIRQTCKNFFHGIDFGCSPQTGVSCPDFLKVARAFGFEADVCDNIDQLDEKLDQFLNCTKPFVLLVRQQLDDPVLPKLMSKLDHNGKMTSPKLHDMYPFVSEEDMKWLLPYE